MKKIVDKQSENISEKMASFKGEHKSTLILEWGPPTDISTDGKDGEVYIYSSERGGANHSTKYDSSSNSYKTTSRDNSYTAKRMFYIDKEGIIYHYKWEGL